jgi:hypothetical protein
VRHPLFGNPNLFARLWISANPRRPVRQREGSKTPNLNAMPVAHGFSHRIEKGFDGELTIAGGERRSPLIQSLGKPSDQFSLCH